MKEKEKKTHFMLATIFLKHCCKGPCGSLVEEGITYFGVVVAQIPDVDSAESCASLCKEEVKCLFWTFKIIKQLYKNTKGRQIIHTNVQLTEVSTC